jgi:hypothetical protein
MHVARELQELREEPERALKLAAFIREQNVREASPMFASRPGRFPERATIREAERSHPANPLERMKRIAVSVYFLQGSHDKDAVLVHGKDHPLCFAADTNGMTTEIRQMVKRGIIEIREETIEHTLVRLRPVWRSAIREAVTGAEDRLGSIHRQLTV